MATSMFIRFSNFRNLLKINSNVLGISSNTTQCLESISRLSSTQQSEALTDQSGIKILHTTKAMQTYMKRIKKHEELMEKEVFEYEKGKRHLANMMGMDAENFTDEDVDRSLEYLFPSGLYDPKARPLMKHPKEIFPPQKVAEFSADGKPLHPFFFMITPVYYETLHSIVEQLRNLDDLEDKFTKSTGTLPNENKMDPHESVWITKVQLENLLLEKLYDDQYEYFIKTMEKLLNHPLSQRAEEFIMKYRIKLAINTKDYNFLPIMYTEDGKPYVKVFPCQRKSATATVTVFGEGTGKITINGKDISYFKDMQSRQQVIFPLIFTNMIEKVDIEAVVEGGGNTGQSGAIRWGIAWGLRSFVTPEVVQNMKIAGLLTRDWRIRERKKFGQEGARRKFTWKKR
ncbi:PREDICTED: 28S ribosomal protein S9, mitochondrial-like isoform X1 [Polistes canadensis]|uniref:28S ribosomal protein S9, mitochondrial-like isoform X1 n=2 Tax=Polistes canadensis TaxID=91411 RepID=UPI000718C7FA|nr:PREDICTED: 28S ribosomal protein S9, mitochondrial-like isoform X1 [Polistes canadensis]